LLEWRNLVCGVMMVVVPSPRMAQDNGRALLHNKQQRRKLAETRVQRLRPPQSSPTPSSRRRKATAPESRIDAEGSTLLVGPETVVQFQGPGTRPWSRPPAARYRARKMKVLVGCLAVAPITPNRTQYDVTDIDGKAKCCLQKIKDDVGIELHGSALGKTEGSYPARSCGKASQPPEANTAEDRSDQPRERPAAEPSWIALGQTALESSPWV
jgi:hypothetical protein